MKNDFETDLVELLNELSTVQDELFDVLQRKRDRMAGGDLQGMRSLEPAEAALQDRLTQCHERRAQMLDEASASGLPHGSLGELASVLPSESAGKLQKQVKQSADRMRMLQHNSLKNCVIAQRSLFNVSKMINCVFCGLFALLCN